jgi:nitrogen fixation/metabolism regulation signal transduction histidine kinase
MEQSMGSKRSQVSSREQFLTGATAKRRGPATRDEAGLDGGTVRLDGGTVRMTVSDDGTGMSAELLPQVFDRFRIGNSGNPRGTGLGLALVRAVARAHGGEVLVRSWPGHGSEFEFLLPPYIRGVREVWHRDGTDLAGGPS